MNEIYVTGHRNPDTDSIVAAMSYAALKNALGEKEYVAVHLGTISDETNRMLERFHFKPPRCIQNVRTQVQDLDFDRPPCLDASVTMDRAWKLMRDQKISAIPVVNEDGTLYGMLSALSNSRFSQFWGRAMDTVPLTLSTSSPPSPMMRPSMTLSRLKRGISSTLGSPTVFRLKVAMSPADSIP